MSNLPRTGLKRSTCATQSPVNTAQSRVDPSSSSSQRINPSSSTPAFFDHIYCVDDKSPEGSVLHVSKLGFEFRQEKNGSKLLSLLQERWNTADVAVEEARTSGVHLQVLKRLGSGGQCEVLHVQPVNRRGKPCDKCMALKLLTSAAMATGANYLYEQQLAFRELMFSMSVDSKDIVKCLGAGFAGVRLKQGEHMTAVACIIMEVCQSTVLDHMQKDNDPCDLLQRMVWGLRAFQAVQYLHGKRVVHRDLKLSNLLLTDAYVAKLADLGLGRLLGDSECAPDAYDTHACGTTGYMAPERVFRARYAMQGLLNAMIAYVETRISEHTTMLKQNPSLSSDQAAVLHEEIEGLGRYLSLLKADVQHHSELVDDQAGWEKNHLMKSDSWSLACVTLELLTHGDPPFLPLFLTDGDLKNDETALLYLISLAIAENKGDAAEVVRVVYNDTCEYPWVENKKIMSLLGKMFSVLPEQRPSSSEAVEMMKAIVHELAQGEVEASIYLNGGVFEPDLEPEPDKVRKPDKGDDQGEEILEGYEHVLRKNLTSQISASNILPKMSGGEQHAATAAQLAANAIRKQPQALSKKGALNPSSLNGRASTLPQAAPHGLAAGGRWFSTPQALKKATTAAASACKTPGRQPSKQVIDPTQEFGDGGDATEALKTDAVLESDFATPARPSRDQDGSSETPSTAVMSQSRPGRNATQPAGMSKQIFDVLQEAKTVFSNHHADISLTYLKNPPKLRIILNRKTTQSQLSHTAAAGDPPFNKDVCQNAFMAAINLSKAVGLENEERALREVHRSLQQLPA